MKRRLIAGLLAVAFFLALTLEADTSTLEIEGGSPEARAFVEEVLSWPEVPEVPRGLTVTIVDGHTAFAGSTGIVIGEFHLTGGDPFALLHEYGHVWDRQRLTFQDRFFVMACMDLDCNTPHDGGWRSGYYNEQPAERWAQSFAAHVLTERRQVNFQTWGEFPERLVARMIRFRTNFPVS